MEVRLTMCRIWWDTVARPRCWD